MSITKNQIIEAVSAMSVMEVTELVSEMEKRFGISSSIISPNVNIENTSGISATDVAEEKTEFDVILESIGTNKIAVIKAVRNATSLGLKEAKDLVESSPILLKGGVSKDDADFLRKSLEEVGAKVTIK